MDYRTEREHHDSNQQQREEALDWERIGGFRPRFKRQPDRDYRQQSHVGSGLASADTAAQDPREFQATSKAGPGRDQKSEQIARAMRRVVDRRQSKRRRNKSVDIGAERDDGDGDRDNAFAQRQSEPNAALLIADAPACGNREGAEQYRGGEDFRRGQKLDRQTRRQKNFVAEPPDAIIHSQHKQQHQQRRNEAQCKIEMIRLDSLVGRKPVHHTADERGRGRFRYVTAERKSRIRAQNRDHRG